ncbi:glycerophosphoryl diester phosphodiesterase membrane domain-containing protein [Actinomadura sp. ATCC 31491]|uniref:Glycerophosphoryl diester phosphodiesterase membrane domain-containing protein n=1 Tax=Actinomadura luzonensis TaxID=2805427 RepID=A0ABT0GAQ8_9ACTN|nr:glycerophosphoryl diester phosphodiesterase membrane domain-containing protein [Actinomadura luzonensis]MCK2221173.1 glycerophosphoryl diester phosphodiesterase membrane domain-containing protein [Actinomadura luzonensis]
MSDGHGPSPETPPGWSAAQPPPYSAPPASPWTAPGAPEQAPYGQPYGQTPQQQPYGPGPQTPHPPYPQPGHGYLPPPALRPGIIPLRPLGLGDMLDGTIKLIRSNPKAVLGLSAVAALLASVPVAVGQAFVLDEMGTALTDPERVQSGELTTMGGLAAQYGGALISYAVQFVVVTLLTGVLTRILGRAVFGGNLSAGEAWQLVKARVPALFGVVGLMVLVMGVPLAAFVVIGVALAASGAGVGTMLGVIVLFLVLYVAYYLFFRTRFAFASPAVVLEGRGPIDAMRRSWHLVTGDFWRVLGILLLTSLLVGVVAGILSVPFTIAGTLFGMLGAGSVANAVVSAVLIAVGATLGAMFTYPFEAGVAGLLYADRRMRSEAFDLVLQTAAIEQQRQGWVHASADELWHPSNSARS